MRILASIHLYPPKHNCGAEYMMHQTLKYLQSKGHEVRVLLWQSRRYKIDSVYDFEGVDVFPPSDYIVERLFEWCDLIFTHLDYTQTSINYGAKYNKKVFHFIHNWSRYASIDFAKNQYVIYNSEVAKEKLQYNHESIVLHPPVDYRFYDTEANTIENEFVTLINLDYNKGGQILAEIAKRMPKHKFLAVKGSYSADERGQYLNQPSNVKIVENTSNIREIYKQSRIVLMPSKFESWGRVATEAMCSGIPVISSGTEGLRENCGEAGIYVDIERIDKWVKEIIKLDKPENYKKASDLARKRSRELDPIKELEQFNNWICTLK
jgi:glycosyltransferase involved in cell wall biosynthesis